MSIVDFLSSNMGDKTEASNIKVAVQCIENPNLLVELASSFNVKNDKLLGDCVEVFTKVAEENPTLVVPFVERLAELLLHKSTRVRWEAAHSLALTVEFNTSIVNSNVSMIRDLIINDKSTIVRDYSVDIIANFAKSGKDEVQVAFPILKEALYIYEGKHAAHALNGFINIAKITHEFDQELIQIGNDFVNNNRGVINKAAKALLKALK